MNAVLQCQPSLNNFDLTKYIFITVLSYKHLKHNIQQVYLTIE